MGSRERAVRWGRRRVVVEVWAGWAVELEGLSGFWVEFGGNWGRGVRERCISVGFGEPGVPGPLGQFGEKGQWHGF